MYTTPFSGKNIQGQTQVQQHKFHVRGLSKKFVNNRHLSFYNFLNFFLCLMSIMVNIDIVNAF